jgi:hypothetical protein
MKYVKKIADTTLNRSLFGGRNIFVAFVFALIHEREYRYLESIRRTLAKFPDVDKEGDATE